MRSNTVEVSRGAGVLNKRWRHTINTFLFCSLSSLSSAAAQTTCLRNEPIMQGDIFHPGPGRIQRMGGINNSQVR